MELNPESEIVRIDEAEENTYFDDVMEYLTGFHEDISKQKTEMDELVKYSLAHYNSDNPEQFTELLINTANQESLTLKTSQTKYALNKPYFARVDFTPSDINTLGKYYIGKMTLMRGLEILITDWRAPVSTLYYEGRIGQAGYESPDGLIEGEISLKRQYDIANGKLNGYTDIDITTNDEFLQAALGQSKDMRLKDIVTTIQAEQNRIIRHPLYDNIVVQGAAGGGKTTIALHRIAYLLYAYENKLKPRQVLILAPNRLFLSYISDVLPDLGVESVIQSTFHDFTVECISLPKKWLIGPNNGLIAKHLETKPEDENIAAAPEMDAARLKSRLRFMQLIEKFCVYIENELAPKDDFMLEGYELFTHEALSDLFLREYSYLPIAKRANEIHKHLANTLKKEKPLILKSIDDEYDRRWEKIKRQMPEDNHERRRLISSILDERNDKMKRVRNQSKVIISRYMNKLKVPVAIDQYIRLFTEPGLFAELAEGVFDEAECSKLMETTKPMLEKHKLETEDLPPLLLMQVRLFGLEDMLDIKHVVIDEAQDYSLFQLKVLKLLTVNASFSILGDLHQGIFAYRGVRKWGDVARHVFPKSAFLTLKQSYRTTVEIMGAANLVIEQLHEGKKPDIPFAEPVIRHGSPVVVVPVKSLQAASTAIKGLINNYQLKGHRSIAVICKTIEACKALKKLLKPMDVKLISGLEDHYSGGLIILPSYMAKGFEFDAVIISDVSNNAYSNNELDIKLLYISMTRALHELSLIAIGENGVLTSHIQVLQQP